MKKNFSLIIFGLIIMLAICNGFYVAHNAERLSKAKVEKSIQEQESEMSTKGFSNQYADIMDGSEGMETTLTGRVGYNYAFTLPNDVYMKFGFDPGNTTGEVDDFSGLGCGWKLKLSYLDVENSQIHRSNGYTFPFVVEDKIKNPLRKSKGNYVLKAEENQMLRDVQEEYEIYDASGRLVNIVYSSGKKSTYTYEDGLISQIEYSDGSVVFFERTEHEVKVIYKEEEEIITVAVFKLEEAFGKVVLKEIELLEDEIISFEYTEDGDNGLLLKSYDNGKYIRNIEYMENSDKIAGYQQIYEDNSTKFENYEYGPYDYISATVGTQYTETYKYEKLEDNCLKITREKFPENGQDFKDTSIFNEFGERFSNRQEISVPSKKVVTLTYEKQQVLEELLLSFDNKSGAIYPYDNLKLANTLEAQDVHIIDYARSMIGHSAWTTMEYFKKEGLAPLMRYHNEKYYSVIPLKDGQYLFVLYELKLEPDNVVSAWVLDVFAGAELSAAEITEAEKGHVVIKYLLPKDLELLLE